MNGMIIQVKSNTFSFYSTFKLSKESIILALNVLLELLKIFTLTVLLF